MEPSTLEQVLLAAGIAAVLVYVLTVVTGAAIRPGYSHYGNAISELVGAGAPSRGPLNVAFFLYNLLIIAFAIGLATAFGDGPSGARLAGWLMAATGVFGIAMTWFPMDPIGAPATRPGIGHLVLAGMLSLGTLGAMLAFALGVGEIDHWPNLALYTYITFGVILVTGGLAAMSAAQRWQSMGLWERLTIGAGMQWIAVVAFTLIG